MGRALKIRDGRFRGGMKGSISAPSRSVMSLA